MLSTEKNKDLNCQTKVNGAMFGQSTDGSMSPIPTSSGLVIWPMGSLEIAWITHERAYW